MFHKHDYKIVVSDGEPTGIYCECGAHWQVFRQADFFPQHMATLRRQS